jgi:PLP dependent protein
VTAAPDGSAVARRVETIRDRIAAAGGDPERVRIVAVTKAFPAEAVSAARVAGLADVGENYAQELLAKRAELGPDDGMTWHFLGRVQRNKVKQLAARVDLWQSVDRPEVVDELGARAPGAALLIQVNATDEEHKGGCVPGEVGDLVARARDLGLDVRGLMTVGPAGDRRGAASAFATVAALADGLGLKERSMGMTDDLEEAIGAGATMVRIGRALFGDRPLRPPPSPGIPTGGGPAGTIAGGV